MLVIRLQRVGKKNQASFRVVLQEKTWSPKGKAKELLGFYNPVTKEKAFQKERIQYWMSKGAQPSPTVHNKFVDEGIVTGAKVKAWQPKKKTKEAEDKNQEQTTEETSTPVDEEKPQDSPAAETPEIKPEEAPKEEPKEETKEDLPAGNKGDAPVEDKQEEKVEKEAPQEEKSE